MQNLKVIKLPKVFVTAGYSLGSDIDREERIRLRTQSNRAKGKATPGLLSDMK